MLLWSGVEGGKQSSGELSEMVFFEMGDLSSRKIPMKASEVRCAEARLQYHGWRE